MRNLRSLSSSLIFAVMIMALLLTMMSIVLSPSSSSSPFVAAADTLTLASNETKVRCSVTDAANTYAFFGLDTVPGAVVRVQLSDLTRVSHINFASGEDSLSCAVTNAVKTKAYFGCNSFPGQVVEVDLTSFQRVKSLFLDFGENYVIAGCAAADFGFFVPSGKSPASAVKIRLSTMTRLGLLVADGGENLFSTCVYDEAFPDYIYFGTNQQPTAKIVRFFVSNGSRLDACFLNAPGEQHLRSAASDGTYAYFGGATANPSHVAKVTLENNQRVGGVQLEAGETDIRAMVVHGAFGMFGNAVRNTKKMIATVDLTTMTLVSSQDVLVNDSVCALNCSLETAFVGTTDGFSYWAAAHLGGVGGGGGGARIFRVPLPTTTTTTTTTTITTTTSTTLEPTEPQIYQRWNISFFNNENQVFSAVRNNGTTVETRFGLFGTTSGKVVRVKLPTLERVDAVTMLLGEDYLVCAVTDPAQNFGFFGTLSQPGKIAKVSFDPFQRKGALELNTGEDDLRACVAHPASDFGLFACYRCDPGVVIQIRFATFERINALTLNSGEKLIRCGVTDAAGEFAFWGLFTNPNGIIVKTRISDNTRVDSLTLSLFNEMQLRCAVAHQHMALFGTATYPSKIVKIDMQSFTRVNAISLNGGENVVRSAVVWDGVALFGTSSSTPNRVVKVDVGLLQRMGHEDVFCKGSVGACDLNVALVDDAASYFGTATSPAEIFKFLMTPTTTTTTTTTSTTTTTVTSNTTNTTMSTASDPSNATAENATTTQTTGTSSSTTSSSTQASTTTTAAPTTTTPPPPPTTTTTAPPGSDRTRTVSANALGGANDEQSIEGVMSSASQSASAASASVLAGVAGAGSPGASAMAGRALAVTQIVSCAGRTPEGKEWLDEEVTFPNSFFPGATGLGDPRGYHVRAAIISLFVALLICILVGFVWCYFTTEPGKFYSSAPTLIARVFLFAIAQIVTPLGELTGLIMYGGSGGDMAFAFLPLIILAAGTVYSVWLVEKTLSVSVSMHNPLTYKGVDLQDRKTVLDHDKKHRDDESSSKKERALLRYMLSDVEAIPGAEEDVTDKTLDRLRSKWGRFLFVGDYMWYNPHQTPVWAIVRRFHGTDLTISPPSPSSSKKQADGDGIMNSNGGDEADAIAEEERAKQNSWRGRLRARLSPHCYMAIIVGTLLATFASGVAKGASGSTCRRMLGFIAFVNVLCFLYGAICNPAIVPIRNWINNIVDGCTALMSILVAVKLGTEESARANPNTIKFVSFGTLCIVFFGVVGLITFGGGRILLLHFTKTQIVPLATRFKRLMEFEQMLLRQEIEDYERDNAVSAADDERRSAMHAVLQLQLEKQKEELAIMQAELEARRAAKERRKLQQQQEQQQRAKQQADEAGMMKGKLKSAAPPLNKAGLLNLELMAYDLAGGQSASSPTTRTMEEDGERSRMMAKSAAPSLMELQRPWVAASAQQQQQRQQHQSLSSSPPASSSAQQLQSSNNLTQGGGGGRPLQELLSPSRSSAAASAAAGGSPHHHHRLYDEAFERFAAQEYQNEAENRRSGGGGGQQQQPTILSSPSSGSAAAAAAAAGGNEVRGDGSSSSPQGHRNSKTRVELALDEIEQLWSQPTVAAALPVPKPHKQLKKQQHEQMKKKFFISTQDYSAL